jgi:hypothetical protein
MVVHRDLAGDRVALQRDYFFRVINDVLCTREEIYELTGADHAKYTGGDTKEENA